MSILTLPNLFSALIHGCRRADELAMYGWTTRVQIECLACGEVRSVTGVGTEARGECPRCHYLGWAYSDELDASTRREIMNGELAVPPAARPRRDRGRSRRNRFD